MLIVYHLLPFMLLTVSDMVINILTWLHYLPLNFVHCQTRVQRFLMILKTRKTIEIENLLHLLVIFHNGNTLSLSLIECGIYFEVLIDNEIVLRLIFYYHTSSNVAPFPICLHSIFQLCYWTAYILFEQNLIFSQCHIFYLSSSSIPFYEMNVSR